MAITHIPVDADGNMQSYPERSYGWESDGNGHRRFVARDPRLQELPPFEATMRVVGMETGRSAKRLILEDQATGKKYRMFVADIVNQLKGVDLVGTWEPCKRGQNYGIRKVKNG